MSLNFIFNIFQTTLLRFLRAREFDIEGAYRYCLLQLPHNYDHLIITTKYSKQTVVVLTSFHCRVNFEPAATRMKRNLFHIFRQYTVTCEWRRNNDIDNILKTPVRKI
jgi:hypothetical protein